MSIGEKIRKIVEETDERILFLQKEFDEALIGTARACGKSDVAAYDLTKCMEIMIDNHGIGEMEALDQVRNSIDKAPSGTYKPIFINDFRNYDLKFFHCYFFSVSAPRMVKTTISA